MGKNIIMINYSDSCLNCVQIMVRMINNVQIMFKLCSDNLKSKCRDAMVKFVLPRIEELDAMLKDVWKYTDSNRFVVEMVCKATFESRNGGDDSMSRLLKKALKKK